MSGRAPVPASLKKQIAKYLMAAKSFKKLSPVTSLYCKLYALDIAKGQFNNDTRAYILQLADDCIAEKDALNPEPEDAKKQIRATASNIFKNIYNNESTMAKKQAAKGYRDCFVCFEILKHPNLKDTMNDGELAIYQQNAKYCTFKAASVINPDIIKDEIPEPPPALQKLIDNDPNNGGGDGGDEDDDDALLKELEDMEMDNSGDPWASFNSSQKDNIEPKYDQQLADAKENEMRNDNMNNMNDNNITNDTNNDINNNNNNNDTNMNNMNPYYGGTNPYYGAPSGPSNPTDASGPSAPGGATAPDLGGMDDGIGSLPSPPPSSSTTNNERTDLPNPPHKQPSFQDLSKPLPTPKYERTDLPDNDLNNTSNIIGSGTDYSSYLNDFSEERKMWTSVKNGQKYQKECEKTIDQAIYCLMLGEPDFRGTMEISGKAKQMINLCRQSVGLKPINLPNKPPTDIPGDNVGGKTDDWWAKPIGKRKYFRLQELSFEAESRLKKVKRHIGRGEIPTMETFILLAEATSFLQPIAAIQPAWE